jgi:hypothetical protein
MQTLFKLFFLGGDCASLNITNLWQKFMPGTEPPKELQSQLTGQTDNPLVWTCQISSKMFMFDVLLFLRIFLHIFASVRTSLFVFEAGTEQRMECHGLGSLRKPTGLASEAYGDSFAQIQNVDPVVPLVPFRWTSSQSSSWLLVT